MSGKNILRVMVFAAAIYSLAGAFKKSLPEPGRIAASEPNAYPGGVEDALPPASFAVRRNKRGQCGERPR